ncbi:Gfo/Idh/MocA family protein [Aliiglaciecola lipolytica]|uniref:Glucose-fructose oxidoreductase n=1 Tax=Aliiglaciecola lipolytica E3 TaxID=1127673 RepID=K6X5L4_9ALTE|nr:Gfo/Idh/MocA family oxidoreductase [Aliiglaciecola lipolytica]GAC15899.1 glucose-fructose oxidoreductase [Aliiglaciecola lipolytica E3]
MSKINRRRFIHISSAALSLGLLSPKAFALAKNSNKIGVALLGLGYYSRDLLAPALQLTKHCELRGIITGSPHKIPAWQAKYGIKDSNVYSYSTMHNIANNPDIDVIYVVTPPFTHKTFSVAAANAGKHVWCEKPMAMTVEECTAIKAACDKNKVALSIGYRMMHEPNTRQIAANIKSSQLGNVVDMQSDSGYAGNGTSADNWRMHRDQGGGALYDMGVYCINGTRFISSMEPIAVTASHEMQHAKFIHADDTTNMTLEFPHGIIAKCRTSVVKGYNQLKVNCQNGWYQLKPMQSYSGVVASDSNGMSIAAFKGNQQSNQMDNDALAIMGKGSFLTGFEDGMRDIHIIQKVLESAATGKRVLI